MLPLDPLPAPTPDQLNLDPQDWDFALHQFHRALDLALQRQREIRREKVWILPPSLKQEALPQHGMELEALVDLFQKEILPYPTGNTHPNFFGWVHGSGNIYGALGEALAGVMNCNVGGRNHIGTVLEKQVVGWFQNYFSFPSTSGGILTSGSSMGTVIALNCARNTHASWDVQRLGMSAAKAPMLTYASVEAHSCITKALDLLGMGRDSLRQIPVAADFRMDTAELEAAIAQDRAEGLQPFCVVSSIGSVNTGSVDDLETIAQIARREKLWHHIDGAFGAFAICHPRYHHLAPVLGTADSLAFDMHKWLHVPYSCGCVLIQDGEIQRKAFSLRKEYIQSQAEGIAGGTPWYCDYGPELSRGFSALKVWFTVRALGFQALSAAIVKNCDQAEQLARWIEAEPGLELLAPVRMNIVCFRVKPINLTTEADLDVLNKRVVMTLHNRGLAVPSITTLSGKVAIRVCLTNHRTQLDDLRTLIDHILSLTTELNPP